MIARAALAFAFVPFAANAVDAAPPRYLPEIHGQLANGRNPFPANICLRKAGSEIRQCSYTDADGRFYIPSLGKVIPESAKVGDESASAYPVFWIELGMHDDVVVRLYDVELVDRKAQAVHLDCNISRASEQAMPCVRAPDHPLAKK